MRELAPTQQRLLLRIGGENGQEIAALSLNPVERRTASSLQSKGLVKWISPADPRSRKDLSNWWVRLTEAGRVWYSEN
jgi:hypothetical protein